VNKKKNAFIYDRVYFMHCNSELCILNQLSSAGKYRVYELAYPPLYIEGKHSLIPLVLQVVGRLAQWPIWL
jgi:hypothetical protein